MTTQHTTDGHRPAIRGFLAQFFGDHQPADEDDIFATGFVNSLFIMQLVLFVEGEFELTVEDEDLEMANFNTVAAIDAFVARKRATVAGD
ncbi:acyl carrier protein [Streptomyces profundus]|uniref:acyl carrier protein n=1 Tax=Streptomyces profundus TaxID=2867410 RepID=UPI001D160612|nr:phosphopantetheine-binding protein [Streptomyces sp. MA3_2.13]UED83210.1 acyl carrier protein [Streptomyces sp. MA3_2.13]